MSIFSRKRKNGLNEDLPFTISEETISYLMPVEQKPETREEQVIDEKSFDLAFMAALGFTDGNVTFEQALQIPAVAASIDFISSICARVPVKLYEENGSDTNELTDDGRVTLLNGDTGDLLNAYQMKKAWVRDYFDGRGYIYINQRRNRVESLHYVEKAQISVSRYTNPIFKDADIHVAGSRYYPWEFLRLCRNTKDGVTGESITDSSSLILSLYYETMKFERRLMNKGGNKKGFLTSEKKIGDEALSKMRETWHNVFDTNSESMMVLNSGIKFQEASATSTELQLNENKETNSNDILLLFLLSAKALQGASDDEIVSAVKTACIPIIEQMEAAYNSGLLLESEKKTKYFSCDTSKLERGDILKRYQAYEIALKSHFMQPDEVRYEEDKKPLGLNWIELGLDSVLFNPETKEIYTPNTNQSAVMEQRDKDDYIQDPETGRMQGRTPSGTGENDLTDGSESGKISPTGKNMFKVNGFRNKQKLKNHWENGRTHKDEFIEDGIKTAEEYEKAGMNLVQSKVGGDILGHADGRGNIIRYDRKKNYFAKGNPEKGLTTFMKPKIGEMYYQIQREEDLAHGGKA